MISGKMNVKKTFICKENITSNLKSHPFLDDSPEHVKYIHNIE